MELGSRLPPGPAGAPDDLLALYVASIDDYAILMLDVSGNVATWNAGAERIKGYRSDSIIGRHFSTFYPDEDVAAGKPQKALATALANGRFEDQGWRIRNDGTRFWASVTISALYSSDGSLRGFSKITRDLTERRLAQIELQASEERFRAMVEGVQDYAILMLDAHGNVTTWNPGAERIKGYRCDEIIGRHFSAFYPPADIARGKCEHLLKVAAGEGHVEDEGWRIRRDGTRFWANVVITSLRNSDGNVTGYAKITKDLTERRNHEQQLEFMANHDPLTGVRNRRAFVHELEAHAARAARYGAEGAVLVLDLDNFKYLNDTYGHKAGDQVVVRIAHGLQARLRGSDVLARVGGDEFAVLLPCADESAANVVAQKLLQAVREEAQRGPFVMRRPVSASIGIALFADGERLNAEQIMLKADLAMYDAKEAGRDQCARYHYSTNTSPNIESRMQWARRIGEALDLERFELFAQSIHSLTSDGAARKQPREFELLLRLRDESGALILPGAFLGVAERLGLIGQIDHWVVTHAIDLLHGRRTRGADERFHINLSGRSLGDLQLLETIERRMIETGVPPDRLVFEVTETAVVADLNQAAKFTERLSQLGCGLALDDFGVGFASFYYVKHLPFTCLKIDGEFVEHCDTSETDRLLISAVVKIARGMGLRTIAEFVSSDAVVDVLRALGVDDGQGFHLGKPAPL